MPIFLALGACSTKDKPPPRSEEGITVPDQSSMIAVPVSADLADLSAALEREIPKNLWTINKADQICVPSEKIDLALFKVKTPTIKCRIVGQVTRGKMSLSGNGQDIVVTIPMTATVRAKDVGGILKQETGTANARIRAIVKIDMQPDWTPKANVKITYDWTNEPGIDFLGQRIKFTDQADAKLKGVVSSLEKTLPRELSNLNFKSEVQRAWAQAFTSLELNHAKPPVWMRITPQELHYGGYSVARGKLTLRLGLKAKTETYVGNQPEDPTSTPLPPMKPLNTKAGTMLFVIPVIADYKQLEPIILKALIKRSKSPFEIPGIGPVKANFQKVTAYGTDGGRIAVGVNFAATDLSENIGNSSGTVWLTATPVNVANTRKVSFEDLAVTAVTDNTGTDLLFRFANSAGLTDTIADSLTQNFAKDYDDLLSKVGRAIDQKREGNIIFKAQIDNVTTGALKATGQGLYLPVYGKGTASIVLDAI